MTVPLVTGRFLYYAGRVLSAAGLVGAFEPPTKKLITKATTGPFDSRNVSKQTGHIEVDDLSLNLWADTSYSTLISQLHNVDASERVAVWGISGDTAGQRFDGLQVYTTEFKPRTEPADLIEYEVTLQPRENGIDHGVILRALASATGAGNTEGSSIDNGNMAAAVNITSSSVANPTHIITAAVHGLLTGDTVRIASHSGSTPDINGDHVVTVVSTTEFTIAVNVTVGGTGGTCRRTSSRNGGAAYLQVTGCAKDGGTSFTVKVRDSADNATFSDLVSFTAITAEYSPTDVDDGTAERKAITGSIDRYAAVAWSYGGSPGGSAAATFSVGLARYE